MAYDRKKILIFGVACVAIAALIIITFAPVQREVGISSAVVLHEIPGYGFQFVKVSGEQAGVVHLNVTLYDFEIKQLNGSWVEASDRNFSINLLRGREISFTAPIKNLNKGTYTNIRFSFVQGIESSSATLSNGNVVAIDFQNINVELATFSFEIDEATENLLLVLKTDSGVLSNYMLPKLHLVFGTIKAEVDVTPISRDNGELSEATFEQLFSNPVQYDDTNIVIEGFYFHGWEVIVICEELDYSGFAEGHLVPKGRMIWVEGGIPKDVLELLNKQEMMGPEERFGKIRVKGKFQYGGKYGHLGGYNTQIIPFEVELLQ